MKKSILGIAVISLILSACTSQKLSTSSSYDDVYNTSAPQVTHNRQKFDTPPVTGAQVITTPDSISGVQSRSSTFADDYNDYSYSSRINRFNSSDTTKGYFDDSYTGNSVYGSSGSSEPTVNIYLGYGFGNYWGPSTSFGFGWGYPYYGWGYDWGWGYPYSGWYSPWYSPWYNPWYYSYYYPGYYGCCCCYPWYHENYPPYYANDYYYGSRRNLTSTDRGISARNDRIASVNNNTLSMNNDRTSGSPANARVTETAGGKQVSVQPAARTTPSNQSTYKYNRSTRSGQAAYSRSGSQQVQTRGQQPAPRYSRQGSTTQVQRSGNVQSYTSPAYRQPKSSQEYIRPRSQNAGSARSAASDVNQRSNQVPSTTGYRNKTTPSGTSGTRSYSTPSRSNSPGYSTPSRSGSNYTVPSRSGSNYSAPSRSSGGSYSAPSGGGQNYSAPSRSGGGSGSAPSGGSTGGGGGRRR